MGKESNDGLLLEGRPLMGQAKKQEEILFAKNKRFVHLFPLISKKFDKKEMLVELKRGKWQHFGADGWHSKVKINSIFNF